MKIENIKNFKKGWFIGNFSPTIFNTDYFEVAVKKYKAGDTEGRHVHKISTEYTVIISGEAKMNGITCKENDIVILNPGESTDFVAITDISTIVVKVPCSKGDKYVI